MSRLTESTVEDAALAWLGEFGYAVLHGPEIEPDLPAAPAVAAQAGRGRGRNALKKLAYGWATSAIL